MVVADLHVHTTNSDGELTLERLPAAAERAGLDAVAVTDHDRLHPELSDPLTTLDGVECIHGIELRVETADLRLDLLGYGVERTDALESLVDSLQVNRIERARQIVDCVEDRLGVTLDVDFAPGVGRPHIARAIAASDAEYGYKVAFAELIGDDRPCYVPRDIPSFATGKERLDAACKLVGLAHPLRYSDPARAMELATDLDAIEVHYPYSRDVDVERVRAAANTHDLVVTGGSDAHEETLGQAGLGLDAYEVVRDAIGP